MLVCDHRVGRHAESWERSALQQRVFVLNFLPPVIQGLSSVLQRFCLKLNGYVTKGSGAEA